MTQPSDEARLLQLAEAVADGLDVDWADAESSTKSPAARDTIQQLRELARLLQPGPADPPADPARPPSEDPRLWGPLELREEVGRGIFGTVYRAWDLRLDHEVALKLLHSSASARPHVASTIIEEGRLLARVRHTNVVTIYGADRFDGRIGLWTEFIHGQTLKELLRERGSFGAREATLIGIDLCRALAAVHKVGLVHRDLKAQNVMREAGGRIVLMDFGAGEAVATVDGARLGMAGTPLYMAPEILAGGEASAQSDLYSLGVLLFHLVTGSFPVSASTVEDLHAAHQRREPANLRDLRPGLPPAFVRVVEQATSFDPADRFASAGAMERALERALDDDTRSATDVRDVQSPVTVDRAGRPAAVRASAPEHPVAAWWWDPRVFIGAGMAVALAVGLLVEWLPSGRHANLSQIRSIAVLPFSNVSQDKNQQYIVDGLTDELNASLGTIGALTVKSCSTCPRTQSARDTRSQAAKELSVDALIEGSLMMSGGRSAAADRDAVKITVTLIQAVTDEQLWTKTFEGTLTDILTLQRAIVRAVADEISITVTAQEQARLDAAAHHVAPEAYKSYLMGRSLLAKRSVEGMQQSLTYFERAARIDQSFAKPYAGLADAYILLAGDQGAFSTDQGYAAAMGAAQKALAIDPGLADAFASMAFAKYFLKWDFRGADGDFKKAITINPSYSSAHHWYGDYLTAMGRPEEAVAEMKRAVELDPLSDIYNRDVAWPYFFNRQYDEAIAQLQQALRRSPQFLPARSLLARAYAQRGLYEQAVAESRKLVRDRGTGRDRAELAAILALSGEGAEAERIVASLLTTLDSEYVAPYDFALIYAALRKPSESLSWLERAYRERDATLVNVRQDPRFDLLRKEDRFIRLVARMNF